MSVVSKYIVEILNIFFALGNLASILGFVYIFSKEPYLLFLAIIFLLLFVGTGILLLVRSKDQGFEKCAILADNLHHISHILRDQYYDISTSDSSELTEKFLQERTAAIGEKISNFLATTLTCVAGGTVRVCIKVIEPLVDNHPPSESGLDFAKAVTICRSSNTQKKRFENLEQPVKGNTDFDKIVSGDDFFFAAKLDRMVSSGEYRNTTEKWLQWYKSTVVVPIRVLEKNCDENKKHYILLGFLCADSDSSGAFEEDRATLYADIMMAAADQLYYFLDFISSQRNRLKTDSSNQF